MRKIIILFLPLLIIACGGGSSGSTTEPRSESVDFNGLYLSPEAVMLVDIDGTGDAFCIIGQQHKTVTTIILVIASTYTNWGEDHSFKTNTQSFYHTVAATATSCIDPDFNGSYQGMVFSITIDGISHLAGVIFNKNYYMWGDVPL